MPNPFLDLIDLQMKKATPEKKPKLGRPFAKIQRNNTLVRLSQSELESLDNLVEKFQHKFGYDSCHRGNVIGFMSLVFQDLLTDEANNLKIPPEIKSFGELARWIEDSMVNNGEEKNKVKKSTTRASKVK